MILPEPTLRRLPWYLAYVEILKARSEQFVSSTLMRDSGLTKYGLEIVAGFDNDPANIGRSDLGVPVMHPDSIDKAMEKYPAEICILTVPAEAAQEAADTAIAAGIKAIWNFTPYRVKVAQDVVMANTSIYAHLAIIYNRLSIMQS